ncbi:MULTISPECIES: hypothetical protein [Apibacter]|uniref:hypothetical protein n=1 Tax=Apibacter TaxID=1778601 RepID=UPI00140E9458|nr:MULTISPECIES: hypothetical protein [Apibacter]QII72392.1 hypothetical protein G8C43_06290 [Apibacter sp. B2966]
MFKQIFNIIIFHKDDGCETELDDEEQYSLKLFLKYLFDLKENVFKPIIKDEFQWNK